MTKQYVSSLIAAVGVGLLVLSAPGSARADTDVIHDGRNGTTLDIRTASHGHAGSGFLVHTVTMAKPFASSTLTGRTGITFQFTPHSSSNFTKFVFVQWDGHALRGYIANRRRVIGMAVVSRPNGRTVRVKIPKRFLDAVGYSWMVAAFGPSNVDVAPNRGGLVFHDLSAPVINMRSFPDPSTNVSQTLTFPVQFDVSDNRPGVSWELQQRVIGSPAWSVAAHRAGSGRRTVQIQGVEGANYQFRVRATDAAGNTRTSPTRVVSVPMDDSNAAFSAAYTGIWNDGNDGFLGTLHWASASAGASSFTYTFTGSYFAWVSNTGNPQGGSATVTLDSVPHSVDLSTNRGPHRKVFETNLSAGSHTVTIATATGAVCIDGLVFR